MGKGIPLTDEQIAAVRDAFAQTGRYDVAANTVGCSIKTAQRHCRDIPRPATIVPVVSEAVIKTADDIADATLLIIGPIMAHMGDPNVIAQSSLKDAATAFGIVVDKFLLLTGQATSRTETGAIDPGKLTPEEREMAARIRAKLAAAVDA